MKIQIEKQSLFIILISGFLLWNQVESIRFDLESGHTKCISEDIKSNSMTVGKYHIVNPNDGHPLPDSHKITVRVTSAYGNSYHYSDHVTEGHFAFQTAEAGDYMACFFAGDHKPSTTITVDFDWKSGIASKDWTNVAKKGSVEVMELELKKMFDTVQSIHDEMFYLREREEEMQELNRSTNSKMAWLSFLSFFICLSVAGMQLWHLKSFFEKKKLI
ncbi:transmembrane emp24 domain-containing protein p24delta9-like [Olea europaea var. sylvestris]|uniref:transmembrane emp24 domain-containing protein p24delta9-like n=1 Tax=Olea europaea var. sylvestris TaxID=158386 RepID=UPI000C1D3C53|nr:transmembrane emp24 domain-containing protein p24delta9-like [Olea europaea var. sylvestris]